MDIVYDTDYLILWFSLMEIVYNTSYLIKQSCWDHPSTTYSFCRMWDDNFEPDFSVKYEG